MTSFGFNRPSETAAILTDMLLSVLSRASLLNIEERKALTTKLESTGLSSDPERLIQIKELLGL